MTSSEKTLIQAAVAYQKQHQETVDHQSIDNRIVLLSLENDLLAAALALTQPKGKADDRTKEKG